MDDREGKYIWIGYVLYRRSDMVLIWETQKGVLLTLPDMSESHLINCIRKVERENWRLSYLPYLRAELAHRTLHRYDQRMLEEQDQRERYYPREI